MGLWKLERLYYPAGLPDQRLSFYADRFPTTEVKYSFYHVPSGGTYRRWASLVQSEFLFALNAGTRLSPTSALLLLRTLPASGISWI